MYKIKKTKPTKSKSIYEEIQEKGIKRMSDFKLKVLQEKAYIGRKRSVTKDGVYVWVNGVEYYSPNYARGLSKKKAMSLKKEFAKDDLGKITVPVTSLIRKRGNKYDVYTDNTVHNGRLTREYFGYKR